MTNIIQFQFNAQEVRTLADDNGEPWFAATDVCAVLGYRNAPDAVAKHCRGAGIAKRDIGVVTGKTASGADSVQQIGMTFINEGNLYRLIIKSRKPEAEKFEQLVMEEILPAIRKTGTYTAPKATLSPAQQRHIQNRVADLARSPGNSFANVYRSIKDQFQVGSYKDVPAERYPALCHYLMTAPLEGELVEGQQQAIIPGLHTLTDSQMYEVYVTAFHFAQLHRIFRESRLYDHLTGLGSRIGIDMVDHFTDGGAMAAGLLRQHASEFEGVQRRLRVNAYR
jgi:prophage antirepressor-like protein